MTWIESGAGHANWTAVASSADGNKLAAAVGPGGGIWTSTNDGTTWTESGAPINEGNWLSLASSADGAALAAVLGGYPPYGGIYLSTNGGAAWTEAESNVINGFAVALHSVAISADGTKLAAAARGEGVAVVYYGGVFISTNAGATWVQTSAPYGEPVFWNSIASSSDGTRLAAVDGVGHGIWTAQATVDVPPTILTNPVSTTVSPGGSVTLGVNASGGDLNYQWAFDGTNLEGATGATLTVSNVGSANIGSYTVTVSNPAGSATSQAATVSGVNIEMFAGVVVNGPPGSNYLIESTSSLLSNWTTLTNVMLPSQPYIYIDYSSPANPQQFYRALPVQ